jgi:predicted Zn-dependent protease
MATMKQKTYFDKKLKNMKEGNPKTAQMLLLESGFGKSVSKRPWQVERSKGFQELLAEIDDGVIVKKWYRWAVDERIDKRVSMEAGKEIMKLKDRYPATQTKNISYVEQLSKVIDDSH